MSARLEQFLGERSYREFRWTGATVVQGDPREDGAVELLLKQGLPEAETIALVNLGCGAWVQALQGRKALAIHAFIADHLVCERNLAQQKGSRSCLATPSESIKGLASAQVVVFRLFRDMAFNWDWIYSLVKGMDPQARLHVIGGNDDGIKSVAKRVSQWNVDSESVAVGCHSRWISFAVGEAVSKVKAQSNAAPVKVNTPQGAFSMQIPEGVFSAGHLDQGTALMLSSLGDLSGKSVWDFGCGSGVVSLSALAAGATSVYASDHSAIAVESAKANLASFGEKAKVGIHFLDDGIAESFDYVVTNPPFHLEAKEIRDFGRIWLMACLARLLPGGEILVVCNAFLPYPKFATELGCNSAELAAGNGFKVWRITRK